MKGRGALQFLRVVQVVFVLQHVILPADAHETQISRRLVQILFILWLVVRRTLLDLL